MEPARKANAVCPLSQPRSALTGNRNTEMVFNEPLPTPRYTEATATITHA